MKFLSFLFLNLFIALSVNTALASTTGNVSGNEFNPAMSLILDGRYTTIDNGELALPGFQLGGEAGLPDSGFSTGHNELAFSANIDDKFYGLVNTAIIYGNGETEIELEEAYIETLALGAGFTVKGGRFYSGIGYLNSIHDHAHDFADRPLVYDALFGGHLVDVGLQAHWLAPTDTYLDFGVEATTGVEYPSGENDGNNKGHALFVKTGGDFSHSASWLLGGSYYQSQFDLREAGGHHHGEGAPEADNELLNGEVNIAGIDFVFKWAPNGNARKTHFKLQGELFIRNEEGDSEFTEGVNTATARYDGKQKGYYVQSVFQFKAGWRVGLRYDKLKADNVVGNFIDGGIDLEEFLEESSLGGEGDPGKISMMVDYSFSHFSRVRLQYSRFDNGRDESNGITTLQYVMSLGSHGAHTF